MTEKKLIYKIGNDTGNSNLKTIINGTLHTIPDVFSHVIQLPNMESFNPNYMLEHLMDNLIVEIASPAIKSGTPALYYVGNYALTSDYSVQEIRVGSNNSKVESDNPIVSSLALIAARAVQDSYAEDPKVDIISVEIDMATALPISQHNKINSNIYTNKFLGKHDVTVYLSAEVKIHVVLDFKFVHVLPEGIPTSFYLTSNTATDLDFDLKDKRILHCAIGAGTTEYPITENVVFDPRFNCGDTNGIGSAVNKAIPLFREVSRQEFMAYYLDKKSRFNNEVAELLDKQLADQALKISNTIISQAEKDRYSASVILIYGGGSILLSPFIKDNLATFMKKYQMELCIVPPDLALTIEAKGLYAFVSSDLFLALKETSESK